LGLSETEITLAQNAIIFFSYGGFLAFIDRQAI